jgi:hypothetical protein
MTCAEDQFRLALQTVAADITESSLPPLALPDDHRSGRSRTRAVVASPRGRRWLVSLGAAAAVTAIAVAATIMAGGSRAPRPVPAAPGLWHGVPAYYFAATALGARAVVVDTSSGVTLATARLPNGCNVVRVSAAADDRMFAIACQFLQRGGFALPDRLYLARFDPATHQLSVTPTLLPPISGTSNIAISRDGTRIAVLTTSPAVYAEKAPPKVTLSVYSIATGTVRTWSAAYIAFADIQGSSGVSWGPGPLLAFDYAAMVSNYVYSPQLPGSGIRLLNTNAPSGSLLGASRLAVPTTHLPGGYQQVGQMAISGNGATVATALNLRHGNQLATEYAEFSLATGRLLRRWLPSAFANEWVLWSDLTGKTLAVLGPVPGRSPGTVGLGIMTGDRFTRLRPPAAGIGGIGIGIGIGIAF